MDLLTFVAVPAAAYLLVVALVALDAMIPVVPSEVFVVSAGALSAAGHLQVGWAVAAAVAGAIAGDHVVYAVGRHKLPDVLERSRLGRRVNRSAERAHSRLGSTSGAAIIAARFIPFGRTAGAGAAGLAGVPARRFSSYSIVGALLWGAWMVGLGYVTGSVADVSLLTQVAIGVGVGLLVGVWAAAVHAVVRTRRRMSARAAQRDGFHGSGSVTQPANSTRPVERWVATKPNGRSYATANARASRLGIATPRMAMAVTAAASNPSALKMATADCRASSTFSPTSPIREK